MSHLLDAAATLDVQRCAELARHDAGPLKAFRIVVGTKAGPRLDFGCMSTSSTQAFEDHLCLAEVGERVDVFPVGQGESFPVKAERQALQCAELRDSPAAARAREFHRRNDRSALELQAQHLGTAL